MSTISHQQSAFATKYLQSNGSPRIVEELKSQVDTLKGQLEREREHQESMKGEFDKRLEATRRETREKVQRILEKRFQTQQQQMKEQANKATTQLAEQLRSKTSKYKTSMSSYRKTEGSKTSLPVEEEKRIKSAKTTSRTRNQTHQTPSFQAPQ